MTINFKSFLKMGIAFLIIYAIFLVILGNNPSFRSHVSDIILPLLNIFVVITLFFAAKRSKIYNKRTQMVWWIFLVSQLFWLMGDILWTVFEVGLGSTPSLIYTFIPYFLHITTFIIGLILIPKPDIPFIQQLRRVVDIGIVMTIIFLLLWIIIVHPIINITDSDFYNTFLIAVFYVLLEFVLLYAAFAVFLYYSGQLKNRPISYIIASAFLQFIAISLYGYQSVQGQYVSGGLVDWISIVSYLLLAFAAVLQATKPQLKKIEDCSHRASYMNLFFYPFIPIIFCMVAYFMVLWLYYTNSPIFEGVLLSSGVIIFLVISRQLLFIVNLKRSERKLKIYNRELSLNQRILESSVNEKTVLLKEIHHRVKNNMQIVTSLLEMQTLSVEPDVRTVFKDIQNRVMSMSLIHEKLYISDELSQVKFHDYVNSLAKEVIGSYNLQKPIETTININENIYLDLDTAIPLGLVLNELITNSIKHGFKGRDGKICIKSARDGQNIILTYQDNGNGIPQTFDIATSKTIGMQLINGLTDQIDGELNINTHNPLKYTIKFKNSKNDQNV